jgi:hypothetical protein
MKSLVLLRLLIAESGLDPSGIYGMLLHYALTFVLVVGAIVIFIELWRKGKLDMDESPKIQMMQVDEQLQEEEKDVRK